MVKAQAREKLNRTLAVNDQMLKCRDLMLYTTIPMRHHQGHLQARIIDNRRTTLVGELKAMILSC